MSIVAAYKRSRAQTGLSLTQVSEKAGLQLPNLSAIESGKRIPRVDTLEKALQAAGKKFVPVSTTRASAAEIAEEIFIERQLGRTRDLFRFVVQLSDNLVASTTPEQIYALVIEPVPSTGSQEWDSVIAGVVDYRLSQRGWPVPSWANLSILSDHPNESETPWVGTPGEYAGIRAHFTTSPHFTHRGVFVALEDLESV